MASESPVTSTVFSFGGAGGSTPSSAGSNDSGDTGGTARPPEADPAAPKPPALPTPSSSKKASASSVHSSKGTRSDSHPAGSPTARTSSRSTPGCISSPASRIDEPSKRASSSAATKTTRIPSRARDRRPFGVGGTGGSGLVGK